MSEHVLVVFPHPDDEAFSSSGTIASYTRRGVPVTYVCLTLGEMGRNMGSPVFANRETLPLIRKKELEDACNVLGIRDLRLWGLRDKTVEFEDEQLLAERIGAVIEEIHPTLIITYYPGYSVHPDHEACGAAVIRAVKQLPEAKRPVVYCVAFSKNCVEHLGEPDVVNDVRDYFEQKIAAIQSHRSQSEAMFTQIAQKIADKDHEILERFAIERFWIYPF